MVRYFFLSLNVLNCLLGLVVAAVFHFVVVPLLNPVARVTLPAVQGAATGFTEQAKPAQRPPVNDYALISDKNLFHPERTMPQEKQPEKAIPKPDVVLYGTMLADDASYAFIEDRKVPYSTPGRGKRQTILKKGDRLSGYTLVEIAADRIVLLSGEERVVVMLDDKAKVRTGEAPVLPAAARTVATGLSPAQPAAAALPQAMPSAAPVPTSSAQGVASQPPRPSLQTTPSAAQDSASPQRPGIGASGTWPPTRSSIEQTQQKILEGRQMRTRQLQGNP
jgi:hypothetical protein